MDFHLIAIDPPGRRAVGRYRTYRAAIEAVDADTLAQLVAGGGWRRRVEHLIVGPGPDGSAAEHPQCVELGVSPERGWPPGPSDMRATERWLARIRAVCFNETPADSGIPEDY